MKWSFLSFFVIAAFCMQTLSQNSALRILEKPMPDLPNGHGTLDAQGSVLLRVSFMANGEIGNVTPILGLPVANLTPIATDAARKIRFAPAVKDGNPINTTKLVSYSYSWNGWSIPDDNKAEAIINKVVAVMGGDRYLQAKNQVSRGRFSVLKEGIIVSFQAFYDAIIFPDRERTEFKGQGARIVQVNEGIQGWLFNADEETIKDQTPRQIESFVRGRRISLENLLRGDWRGHAELLYVGRRPSSLGKRNDIVKLTYDDGFEVEFEFAVDDAMPQKVITRRQNPDGAEIVEEERFARFIEISGIKVPMIIDRFVNGKPVSRVGYERVEFNGPIADSLFTRPENAKAAKKGMRL